MTEGRLPQLCAPGSHQQWGRACIGSTQAPTAEGVLGRHTLCSPYPGIYIRVHTMYIRAFLAAVPLQLLVQPSFIYTHTHKRAPADKRPHSAHPGCLWCRPLTHSPSPMAGQSVSPPTPEHMGQGALTQENCPKRSLMRRQRRLRWLAQAQPLFTPHQPLLSSFLLFSTLVPPQTTLISPFLAFIPYPKYPIMT